MLSKTGTSLGLGLTGAVEERVSAPALAPRPWERRQALAVDLLVTWTLRDQRAHSSRAGLLEAEARAEASLRGMASFHWDRSSTDGSAAIADQGHMGCRIDRSGGGGAGKVSDVADAVWAGIRALDAAALVTQFGLLGVPPDGWQMPRVRSWPRLGWKREGVEGVVAYEGERTAGPSTPVVIVSLEGVEANRRRYLAWWDALEELQWLLTARALGFAVLPPSVEREPWVKDPTGGIDNAGLLDG